MTKHVRNFLFRQYQLILLRCRILNILSAAVFGCFAVADADEPPLVVEAHGDSRHEAVFQNTFETPATLRIYNVHYKENILFNSHGNNLLELYSGILFDGSESLTTMLRQNVVFASNADNAANIVTIKPGGIPDRSNYNCIYVSGPIIFGDNTGINATNRFQATGLYFEKAYAHLGAPWGSTGGSGGNAQIELSDLQFGSNIGADSKNEVLLKGAENVQTIEAVMGSYIRCGTVTFGDNIGARTGNYLRVDGPIDRTSLTLNNNHISLAAIETGKNIGEDSQNIIIMNGGELTVPQGNKENNKVTVNKLAMGENTHPTGKNIITLSGGTPGYEETGVYVKGNVIFNGINNGLNLITLNEGGHILGHISGNNAGENGQTRIELNGGNMNSAQFGQGGSNQIRVTEKGGVINGQVNFSRDSTNELVLGGHLKGNGSINFNGAKADLTLAEKAKLSIDVYGLTLGTLFMTGGVLDSTVEAANLYLLANQDYLTERGVFLFAPGDNRLVLAVDLRNGTIDFGDGNDTLVLRKGGRLSCKVKGFDNDTLTLDGGTADAAFINDFHSRIKNFNVTENGGIIGSGLKLNANGNRVDIGGKLEGGHVLATGTAGDRTDGKTPENMITISSRGEVVNNAGDALHVSGALDNAGSIRASDTAVMQNGALNITNSGIIHGGNSAILSGDADIRLENHGKITSDQLFAIQTGQNAYIENAGEISGIQADGKLRLNNERQTGPVQAGELALVNKGCILSAENTPAVATEKLSSLENSAEGSINGIRIDSGDSVINNFGKILGSGIQWIRGTLFNEDTVTALAGQQATVFNNGTIMQADSGTADIHNGAKGVINRLESEKLTLDNSGTVELIEAGHGKIENNGTLGRVSGRELSITNQEEINSIQAAELSLVNHGRIAAEQNEPAVTAERIASFENASDAEIQGVMITGRDTRLANAGKITGNGIELATGSVENSGTIAKVTAAQVTVDNRGRIGRVDADAADIRNQQGSIGTIQADNLKLDNQAATGPVAGQKLDIHNSGKITVGDGFAVAADSSAKIENGAEGEIEGIRSGTSDFILSNKGKISGNGLLTNGGEITNHGIISAIQGSGEMTLDNSGEIGEISAETMTLRNSGNISSASDDATISGQKLDIVNSGEILNTVNQAIRADQLNLTNSERIEGNGDYAVSVGSQGTIVNTETGVIKGNRYGIKAEYADTELRVENRGSIIGVHGADSAIDAKNLEIINSGSITSESEQAAITGDQVSLTNTGNLETDNSAIHAGSLTLDNQSAIRSRETNALEIENGAKIVNRADGSISGKLAAVKGGESSRIDLENEGTIRGEHLAVIGGDVSIRNQGNIEAGDYAVKTDSLELVNAGTIKGAVHTDSGSVRNSGTMEKLQADTLDLTNSGAISATEGSAVAVQGNAVVENQENGTISGIEIGGTDSAVTNAGEIGNLRIKGNSTLTNSGRVTGNTVLQTGKVDNSGSMQKLEANSLELDNSGSLAAVSASGNTRITNQASGNLGELAFSGNNTEIRNDGDISRIDGTRHIRLDNAGAAGRVTAESLTLVNTGRTDNISVRQEADITNSGRVRGLLQAADMKLNNSGEIQRIEGSRTLDIANTGTIGTPEAENAIRIASPEGTVTLDNQGILTASDTLIAADGNLTLNNLGTLERPETALKLVEARQRLTVDNTGRLGGSLVAAEMVADNRGNIDGFLQAAYSTANRFSNHAGAVLRGGLSLPGGAVHLMDQSTYIPVIDALLNTSTSIMAQSVTIDAGAAVAPEFTGEHPIRDGQSFTIVSAEDINQNFTNIVNNYPLFQYEVLRESDAVSDRIVITAKRGGGGSENPQPDSGGYHKITHPEDRKLCETSKELDLIYLAPPDEKFDRLLGNIDIQKTAEAVTGAVRQLSPMVYTAIPKIVHDNSRFMFDKLVQENVQTLRAIRKNEGLTFDAMNEWEAFLITYGRWNEQREMQQVAGFSYSDMGGVAGIRQTVDGKFTYGAALGGSLTNINFRDASGSDGKLLSVRPMLFASYRYEDFHIDVAGGYAYHDLQITRNIRYGNLDYTAKSNRAMHELSFMLNAGYEFHLTDHTIFEPVGGLYVAGLWENSSREHGAGAASLSIRSGSSFSLESHLGFRLAHEWELNENFKLTPELSARWLHQFGDNRFSSTASFERGRNFTYCGAKYGRDAVDLGISLKANLFKNLDLGINYNALIGDRSFSNSITAFVNYVF